MNPGAIDCKPVVTPFSVADAVLVPGAAMQGGLMEGLGIVHAGELDVGFLGGAQIDKYGNLNTHVIGDYYKPESALCGQRRVERYRRRLQKDDRHDAPSEAALSRKRRFCHDTGLFQRSRREGKDGFPGGGPSVVVSTMGILRFHRETKEMYLRVATIPV